MTIKLLGKILIVEDDKLVSQCLITICTQLGMEAFSVASAEEAKFYDFNNLQYIFSDYNLKNMNGLEFYHYLKDNTEFKGEFVIITGDPSVKLKYPEMSFIEKPFLMKDIQKLLLGK